MRNYLILKVRNDGNKKWYDKEGEKNLRKYKNYIIDKNEKTNKKWKMVKNTEWILHVKKKEKKIEF